MIKKEKGLTLIELLAVIAIIAILFVLLIPQISSAIEKARVTGVQTDFRSFETGVKSYYMETAKAAKTEDGLNERLDKNLQFVNNVSKEKNPWGNPYVLKIEGDKITIETDDGKKNPIYYAIESGYDEDGLEYHKVIGFDGEIKGSTSDGGIDNSEPIELGYCDTRDISTETGASEFNITEISDGIRIDMYNGTDASVVIPCQINGKDVVEIKGGGYYDGAFYDKAITSIMIPNTVKRIGGYAFFNSKLTALELPDSVETLGDGAFRQTEITTLKLSNKMTNIPNEAFFGDKLTTVVIPNSIVTVGAMAFQQNNLSSVTLGSKIEVIEDWAFMMNQITEVTIPNSVKIIKQFAFNDNQITAVILGNGLEEVGDGAFSKNKITAVNLPNKDIRYYQTVFYNNLITEVVIPDNLTKIGPSMFNNNKITKVTLGMNTKKIGSKAFYENPNLTQVLNYNESTTYCSGAFDTECVLTDKTKAFSSNPTFIN